MKKGFGDYAICLLCKHYKIAHNSCCSCKNYTEKGLILNTLDHIIEKGGSVGYAKDCIPVSKSMLTLLSEHLRNLTIKASGVL